MDFHFNSSVRYIMLLCFFFILSKFILSLQCCQCFFLSHIPRLWTKVQIWGYVCCIVFYRAGPRLLYSLILIPEERIWSQNLEFGPIFWMTEWEVSVYCTAIDLISLITSTWGTHIFLITVVLILDLIFSIRLNIRDYVKIFHSNLTSKAYWYS